MKNKFLNFRSLEFTVQAKGVFIITFICSTILFIAMSLNLHSSFGYTILYFGGIFVFLIGSLNIVVAVYELYEAFVEKKSYRMHINSSLLILSNILIGAIYLLLTIVIENKF